MLITVTKLNNNLKNKSENYCGYFVPLFQVCHRLNLQSICSSSVVVFWLLQATRQNKQSDNTASLPRQAGQKVKKQKLIPTFIIINYQVLFFLKKKMMTKIMMMIIISSKFLNLYTNETSQQRQGESNSKGGNYSIYNSHTLP